MGSQHNPALPVEVEREIFEWTAISYPRAIPRLLRVARRVQLWVEPYLYRIVQIGPTPPYSIMQQTTKPASFYRDAVRHLYLPHTPPFDWSPKILEMCTGTRNFTATGGSPGPALIPILLQMDLRQLSLYLGYLFGGHQNINLKHPLFSSITHLDVFDDIPENDPQISPHLAALPALTHLALNHDVPPRLFREILSDCSKLQVLVNLWDSDSASFGRFLAHNPPVADPRFVISEYKDYRLEWVASARGEPDFWSVAEDFIFRKRSGAIPQHCYWMDYWMDDDMTPDQQEGNDEDDM
ncbi:hypothetical protein DFH07DRAFT_373943 [Mycena maculata]|uniref:Uncharacterized protein n=1 Tax=Mycena maculata TaxID=230809 RepID=A0AAD7MG42_9AGAR|nr:hypothetical protein DFH07DRAFT_373943 [Mycena maculata]